MERLFATLQRAGIARNSLYLAWDFTVASERNLSERALSIRDDAFAALGDTDLADMQVQGSAPQFTVSQVTDYTACRRTSQIARKVDGTFIVPCYLNRRLPARRALHLPARPDACRSASPATRWRRTSRA